MIVFVKGAPEDSILTHCKANGNPTTATGAVRGNHCQAAYDENANNCGACQSNGGGLS